MTYCYTDHFTSFAVFVSPRKLPNDEFSQIASLVSYVLVSISFVALVVSLVLFLISGKYFFKVEANIVYFNYCLAMALAFGLFLFGIESGKFHIIACITIAFLLHYIWLAVFVWTLCNGILIMYKLTIGELIENGILIFIQYVRTVNSLYIEFGYNEIRSYIELNISPRTSKPLI